MNNLIERIDHWGQVAPARLAHVSGDRSLTYGELVRRSNSLAAHLASALPDGRCPVAVLGHKEPELLIAFLGALKAGHAYTPIDAATAPAQRVERIVATAAAPLTLTPERIAALTETDAGLAPAPSRRVGANDPFYIMFTSGSTGDPKGVIITLGCVMSFLNWVMAEQGFVEQAETFLNQVPFSFDLSIMDIYASLVTGGTMFSVTHEDIDNPAQLYRTLARSNATTWFSTPSFAQVCLVERSFSAAMLPRLRRLLLCGETLPPETAAAILDRFPKAEVWNTYGPTETTVATTSIRIDRELLARYRPLPIGYPKPDGRIVVLGEDGRPVADGERGEIVIAGPNVSPGYVGRPDLTARAFFDPDGMRAYHTGDWGHYEGDLLFCEGRRDSQIKLHGHRIELGDVEANLQRLPGVRDGVIVPKIKDGQPDWLAAFVILAEQPDGSEFEVSRALRKQLGALLPAYMLPRKFYFLTTFPMTVNGKADRKKLAAMIEG
jgi:D-alanine--poly(phosphoribitol) ligase subunit 1